MVRCERRGSGPFIPEFRLHLPEADNECVQHAVNCGDPKTVPEFLADLGMGCQRELRAPKVELLGIMITQYPKQQHGRGYPGDNKAGQRFHGPKNTRPV